MRELPPSFLGALAGLVAEPRATIERLLKSHTQPYVLRLLFLTLLTLYIPIFVIVFRYDMNLYNTDVALSLCAMPLLTLLVFFFAETLFLDLLGLTLGLRDVVALVAYSSVPATIMLWLIYAFNLATDGHLSIVVYLLTGNAPSDTRFIRLVPYAALIIHLSWLTVFYYGIQTYEGIHWFTSLVITLCSAVPFYLSLAVALAFGEMLRPGTLELTVKLLTPLGGLFMTEARNFFG